MTFAIYNHKKNSISEKLRGSFTKISMEFKVGFLRTAQKVKTSTHTFLLRNFWDDKKIQ